MHQLRLPSFLLSLCLHAGVIALVFFWPAGAKPPVDLSAPVIDIGIYTIGKPGKMPTAPKSPGASPSVPLAPTAPAPTQPKTPEAPITPPAPAPTPISSKPEVPPVPIPHPDKPVAPPKPEPQKPVTPPKPEPPKQPTKPQSPRQSGDPLRDALRDIGRQQPGGDSLARALSDLQKNSEGQAREGTEGDGPGGQGGDGIGIPGSYMQSLVSRIKPNWEYVGRADRRNPVAVVEISIAKDGTIIDAAIVTSSGDTAFDGSVLKAVRDTVKVEPPPTPALTKVAVSFAYEAMK